MRQAAEIVWWDISAYLCLPAVSRMRLVCFVVVTGVTNNFVLNILHTKAIQEAEQAAFAEGFQEGVLDAQSKASIAKQCTVWWFDNQNLKQRKQQIQKAFCKV